MYQDMEQRGIDAYIISIYQLLNILIKILKQIELNFTIQVSDNEHASFTISDYVRKSFFLNESPFVLN